MPAIIGGKQHHALAVAIALDLIGQHPCKHAFIGQVCVRESGIRNGHQPIKKCLRGVRLAIRFGQADIADPVIIITDAQRGRLHWIDGQPPCPVIGDNPLQIIGWRCMCG